MSKQDYVEQYSRHPRWELLHMKRALSVCGGWFNTEDDEMRLQAIKYLLRVKK